MRGLQRSCAFVELGGLAKRDTAFELVLIDDDALVLSLELWSES